MQTFTKNIDRTTRDDTLLNNTIINRDTLILILIFNNSFGRRLLPRPKRNEFIVEKGTMDSLSHGASKLKAIKDTKGFNNQGVGGEEGWRLLRQVCSRVISQMDFALLCRKLHATLYFPFSRRDDVSLVSLTLESPPPSPSSSFSFDPLIC